MKKIYAANKAIDTIENRIKKAGTAKNADKINADKTKDNSSGHLKHFRHHKQIKKHLDKLRSVEREKSHPLLHKVHKKHKISRKTLFYIKEYGTETHAFDTIIKESIKILLFASIISAFGGIALERIKPLFISIVPLVILLPILNDMLGDYGTIVSSRISTMLHEGRIKKRLFANRDLLHLFLQIMIIAFITAALSCAAAFIVSAFSGYPITLHIISRIVIITLIDVAVIVSLLFSIAVAAGIYLFKKEQDPNNFLIPLTTSIADFGNMIVLFALVRVFF